VGGVGSAARAAAVIPAAAASAVVRAAVDGHRQQVLVGTEVVAVRRLVRPVSGGGRLGEVVDEDDPHVEPGLLREAQHPRLHLRLLTVGQHVGLVEDVAGPERGRRHGPCRCGQTEDGHRRDHQTRHDRSRLRLSHAFPFGAEAPTL
jgi:hypothetical protein